MALLKIFAQLNCRDTKSSADWYQKLFGRRSDVDPMDGLKEWHHGPDAGFQLVSNSDQAGHGSMTLIVSDLASEHERLVKAGLSVGEIVVGDFASFAQLKDPDGNTVVLAEPK
ncbi:VOC family protein [Limimaricola litoreus]|uniref:VOC family protein n=1 Tax=Limimaricola litoreus TaxID=2955316 RepID=A0A9X2FPF6_9RHOB|nr:VOC family protein [Limimaricola litoreus]MCP1167319.1 VOC family protein [Limimaricola litoreus]